MGFYPLRRLAFFWLALILLSWRINGREIPTKKAIPPKMDPIPTLPEITGRVWFDVSIDGAEPQRIVFGLFGRIAPKAVENFTKLAQCLPGQRGKLSGKPLCYKDSKFHRAIPHFGIQGGDFTHGDGSGGESIYGGRFEDESFDVHFNRPYMLAMSNSGSRNSNGSQFFITTVKAQWLTGKYVVFGMVLNDADGSRDVVDELQEHGTYGGTPTAEMVIVDCGVEDLKPEDKEPHYS